MFDWRIYLINTFWTEANKSLMPKWVSACKQWLCKQSLSSKERRRPYPNPSNDVSNSTKAGVTDDPWRRMSWGVVMETRHLTRVRGTVLPSADRTRLRLIRYWLLSSLIVNTLSGPKPSMDRVMLSGGAKGQMYN